MKKISIGGIFLCFWISNVRAQGTTGTIFGTVKDQQGAAVAGASAASSTMRLARAGSLRQILPGAIGLRWRRAITAFRSTSKDSRALKKA